MVLEAKKPDINIGMGVLIVGNEYSFLTSYSATLQHNS